MTSTFKELTTCCSLYKSCYSHQMFSLKLPVCKTTSTSNTSDKIWKELIEGSFWRNWLIRPDFLITICCWRNIWNQNLILLTRWYRFGPEKNWQTFERADCSDFFLASSAKVVFVKLADYLTDPIINWTRSLGDPWALTAISNRERFSIS